jgi:hypothetical protein
VSIVVGTINPYLYSSVSGTGTSVAASDHPKIGIKKFTFRDKKRVRYMAEVDFFELNTCAIKFYVNKQKNSPFRYNHLTYHGDARRIIDTCLQIGVDLHKQNDHLSFCFIGAPTRKEFPDIGYNTTKRFRVYSTISKFLLNPDTFTHMDDRSKSFYVLLNNKAKEKDPELFNKITSMFKTNYTSYYPNLEEIRQQQLTRSTMGQGRRRT